MDKDPGLLELKIELLHHEILEYKIFIEICAVTTLFLLMVYLKSSFSSDASTISIILNYAILISGIALFASIIMMTGRIVYIANTELKNAKTYKKIKIHNLLWSFR